MVWFIVVVMLINGQQQQFIVDEAQGSGPFATRKQCEQAIAELHLKEPSRSQTHCAKIGGI
jgi:hypothetical protein